METGIILSSREWCDLVFEGKNKDFGAYVIRTESTKRHNKAVLWTLIGTILFGLISFGFVKANQYLEEKKLAEQGEQKVVLIDMSEEAKEPEPEVIEHEKPEVVQEEVLKTYTATELQIVEDKNVREEDEIVSQDERMQTDAFAGSVTNSQGSTDLNNIKEHAHDVVVEPEKPVVDSKPEEVFRSVEQMPQFPGGEAALMKFLSSHINYPPMAAEMNVQGKVIVQFVVDKTGKVGEVAVVRSVDKDLDHEAIRVCQALPKFTPGRQNGRPVSVWYTLPIQFKLQGTN
ncbi:MAG: energy transducer TonB [Muribaculaceae bacterium]|nr:energy transducer TonB [Muribaculaceae bacterium]